MPNWISLFWPFLAPCWRPITDLHFQPQSAASMFEQLGWSWGTVCWNDWIIRSKQFGIDTKNPKDAKQNWLGLIGFRPKGFRLRTSSCEHGWRSSTSNAFPLRSLGKGFAYPWDGSVRFLFDPMGQQSGCGCCQHRGNGFEHQGLGDSCGVVVLSMCPSTSCAHQCHQERGKCRKACDVHLDLFYPLQCIPKPSLLKLIFTVVRIIEHSHHHNHHHLF